jgi:hypothetical protein
VLISRSGGKSRCGGCWAAFGLASNLRLSALAVSGTLKIGRKEVTAMSQIIYYCELGVNERPYCAFYQLTYNFDNYSICSQLFLMLSTHKSSPNS